MKKILIAQKGIFYTKVWEAKLNNSIDPSFVKERGKNRGIFTVEEMAVEEECMGKIEKSYPYRGVLTPWGETYLYDERNPIKKYPKGTVPAHVLEQLSKKKVVPLTKGLGTMMVSR